MDKQTLLVIALVCLAWVNVAAFRYLGLLAFFVTAASIPFAERLLSMLEKM